MSARHLSALFFVWVLSAAIASNAFAESKKTRVVRRHRVVSNQAAFSVPLQPFSLDNSSPQRATNMEVAYYAPRAVPVEPRDDEEENERPATIASGGNGPTVAGNHAILRGGVAYAPVSAPPNIKSAIWAVNTIRSKPYHWGGGHGSFADSGYDCSGTVSFALHHAGVLNQPLPSNDFVRFGERGRGRWITIYSRRGHTFAMIAGLRLDTTDFRTGRDVGPRWYIDGRDTRGFEVRHPAGL
jgi:hypothetical protein